MRVTMIAVLVILAGCGPRVQDLPKLSAENVSEAPQSLSAVPSVEAQPLDTEQADVQAALAVANAAEASEGAAGLFGALRRVLPSAGLAQERARRQAIAPKAAVLPQGDVTLSPTDAANPAMLASIAAPSRVTDATPTTPVVQVPETAPASAAVADVDAEPAQQTEKKGIFGLFTRRPDPQSDPEVDLVAPEKAQDLIPSEDVPEPPAVIEAAVQQPAAPSNRLRRTLFSPRRPSAVVGPDAGQVALGDAMAYGQIARVCGAQRGSLGQEIGRYPDRGKGYRLYDSKPGSTALRPHYITGFSDGCVRQFSAALAMFGGTQFHEQVRYERSNRDLPFTPTDQAYEALKSKICGVAKNTPCPSSKVAKLEKDTVFVTVYERFGSNPRWADLLLHDGRVLAKDIKAR
ncbi:hypothetical protein [Algirhabdus cladophorae]|uniref:hypothetical protein n=1 Tax=Algirhabdus cladophorae TaxID=3377108 RepID=UPI003B8451E0